MTRKSQASGVAACILLLSSVAFAQQDLPGTYTGTFSVQTSRNPRTHGLELQIASVEGEKVAGKLKVIGGDCAGDYAVSGKYSNNQLALLMSEGEKLGCGKVRLALTVKDGKLVGKYGRLDTELSK
jgi:hypothetical protein